VAIKLFSVNDTCCYLLVVACFCRAANFSQEPLLWSEMHAISEALQSDFRDENSIYLRGCVICIFILIKFSGLLTIFVIETSADFEHMNINGVL